jgi:two-component system, OmpR family, phosphate regulon sensor histidine kinase PhoR
MTAAGDARDAEHQRIFREAQRAADTIFGHYQLSQILAAHARSATMAETVLDELAHACDAARGGIWLVRPPDGELRLVATAGDGPLPAPDELRNQSQADMPWAVVELEDVGIVALTGAGDRPIDASARRFLSLVRHELAGAFRSAQLAETLDLERTELSAIIQNASDAILVFDAARRVARINPAAQRLFRRDSGAIIGQTCAALYRCDPLAFLGRCASCPVARVLETGDALDGDERVVIAGDGTSTAVVGSYTASSTSVDGRAGTVAMLRDTSELARLAELRRGFLASVSHELRTPIALIRGYVETLLHLEPDPATARHYLERIDATAGRLGHLVEQILDATQLAAGQLVLELEELDLGTLVVETVDQVSIGADAERPGVEIAAGTPLVRADRDRLRQVIENLLGNALKYGNGSTITIRLQPDDGSVELRISDGGIGIPANERELVFEQFHRARNVRERGISGSGLGLAISRRIVEAHGGTLGVSPDEAAGTTAVMRLPAAVPVPVRRPGLVSTAGHDR